MRVECDLFAMWWNGHESFDAERPVTIACIPGTGDLPPVVVLEMAKQNEYVGVVVIGVDDENDIHILASSAELQRLYWLLGRAMDFVMRQADHT